MENEKNLEEIQEETAAEQAETAENNVPAEEVSAEETAPVEETSEEEAAPAETAEEMPLPPGKWQICINDQSAGIKSLGTAEKTITVPPICAMVLVKGDLK